MHEIQLVVSDSYPPVALQLPEQSLFRARGAIQHDQGRAIDLEILEHLHEGHGLALVAGPNTLERWIAYEPSGTSAKVKHTTAGSRSAVPCPSSGVVRGNVCIGK